LFHAGETGAWLRLALVGIPALALIGGLALACFAKVGGIAFLGTPRSPHAVGALEDRRATALPLVVLAAACVALGVGPRLGIGLVHGAARALAGPGAAAVPDAVIGSASTITWFSLAAIAMAAVLWVLRAALVRAHGVRRAATWGCAFDAATPRMQYTASSFAAPLLQMFGLLAGTRVERSASSLRTEPSDLVLEEVALPVWHRLRRAALRFRPMQQGRLHVYLLYVLSALLVLLGYLTFGPRR
jgi:hydrogenase-4 component B